MFFTVEALPMPSLLSATIMFSLTLINLFNFVLEMILQKSDIRTQGLINNDRHQCLAYADDKNDNRISKGI